MSIQIFQVGGSVRDELLGKKSKDIDFAVEAPSFDGMRNYIELAGGKIFQERPEFFTIRANVPGLGAADYVLCRKEGAYSDGRRPDKVEVGTIQDDLARRDFTINAIARNVRTSEIIDPHGGRQDLKEKLLRCVGLPEDRFREDSLRLLRAMRFNITKTVHFDQGIERCLRNRELLDLILNLPVERIQDELTKCFQYDTERTLNFLSYYSELNRRIWQKRNLWLKPTTEQT